MPNMNNPLSELLNPDESTPAAPVELTPEQVQEIVREYLQISEVMDELNDLLEWDDRVPSERHLYDCARAGMLCRVKVRNLSEWNQKNPWFYQFLRNSPPL